MDDAVPQQHSHMTTTTIPHFQEELEQLKARLLEMGGLAEDRVRSAIGALVDRDPELVDQVLAGDQPINQLHIEIDSRCFKMLALHQPMAVDLRAIVSAEKRCCSGGPAYQGRPRASSFTLRPADSCRVPAGPWRHDPYRFHWPRATPESSAP